MKILNKKSMGIAAILILFLFIAVNAMAITITLSRSYRVGPDSIREGTIDFDSSYLGGGETITPASFNLSTIRWMEVRNHRDTSGNLRAFEFNDTSSTLSIFLVSSGLEEVSSVSMSHISGVKFRMIGY